MSVIGAVRTHDPVAAVLAFLLFMVFIGVIALLGGLCAKVCRKPRRQLARLR